MAYEEIVALVGSVGVPAAMCFWFMFRSEVVIKANTEALGEIKAVIQKCQTKK